MITILRLLVITGNITSNITDY